MTQTGKGRAATGRTAPLPTIATPPDAADRWKRLTLAANAAFAEGRCVDADPLYGHALAEADRLFGAAHAGHPVPGADAAPMLVAATGNAAETWLRLGQPRRAGEAMIALCHRLCTVIADERCDHGFREQCLMHLRPASLALIALLPRAGWSETAIAHEAMRARDTALRFIASITPKH